jgi:hypothetical protein
LLRASASPWTYTVSVTRIVLWPNVFCATRIGSHSQDSSRNPMIQTLSRTLQVVEYAASLT